MPLGFHEPGHVDVEAVRIDFSLIPGKPGRDFGQHRVGLLMEDLEATVAGFDPLGLIGILALHKGVEPGRRIEIALETEGMPHDEEHFGPRFIGRGVGTGVVESDDAVVVFAGESVKNCPDLSEVLPWARVGKAERLIQEFFARLRFSCLSGEEASPHDGLFFEFLCRRGFGERLELLERLRGVTKFKGKSGGFQHAALVKRILRRRLRRHDFLKFPKGFPGLPG